MKLTGYIKDAAGNGIPSASVLVATVSGAPTGTGTMADENGSFAMYAADAEDTYLLVSSIGYATALVQYSPGATINLAQKSTELGEVVVTAKRTPKPVAVKKPNYILPISLAGAGTIMFGVWIKYHFFA